MASKTVAMLMLAATSHAAVMNAGSGAFLGLSGGDRMRPDIVAKTLASVEEEWRKDAAVFTEENSTVALEAPGSFAKSCGTVVMAVIQGSGGDRDVAKEYMNNVCSQKVLEGWYKGRCTALASSITEHAMLADNYANRESFNTAKVCSGYWSVFVEAEKTREADEAKTRAEQEKVRAEEEKKAAEAKAEATAKAEADAKVEAARRVKEEEIRVKAEKEQEAVKTAEAAKVQAKKTAEEAKARAAEAAKNLAEKKAEAEAVQKEAQQKLEEANKAEQEHQELLAKHEKAEEVLRNASASTPVTTENSTEVAVEKPVENSTVVSVSNSTEVSNSNSTK